MHLLVFALVLFLRVLAPFVPAVEAPVRSTSSFKLTQPSNIEVGTYIRVLHLVNANGVGAIITTSNKNPNFPGEIFRNFSSALQSIESVESCN